MSLSINTNPLSMHAQRSLDTHVKDQTKLISRLTTGVRIGGAADDPAEQAIASRI